MEIYFITMLGGEKSDSKEDSTAELNIFYENLIVRI